MRVAQTISGSVVRSLNQDLSWIHCTQWFHLSICWQKLQECGIYMSKDVGLCLSLNGDEVIPMICTRCSGFKVLMILGSAFFTLLGSLWTLIETVGPVSGWSSCISSFRNRAENSPCPFSGPSSARFSHSLQCTPLMVPRPSPPVNSPDLVTHTHTH